MFNKKKRLTFEPTCFYCGTKKDATFKRTEMIPLSYDGKENPRDINVTVWCCRKCYLKKMEEKDD